MMKKILIAVGLLVISCSGETSVDIPEEIASLENLAAFSADSEPAHEINLTPVSVFGDTEEILLSEWLTVQVDDRGRVFIGDNRETVIHLYNPDGTYNRQIGREGDGPGEYRGIGVMRSDENFFYHYDRNNRRLTRYDPDTFDVADSVELTVERDDDEAFFRSVNTFYLTDADDEILVQLGMGFRSGRPDIDLSERRIQGHIFNTATGTFSGEEIYSFRANEALVHFGNDGSMAVMSVPYKRTPVVHVTDGQIIHGWNEHFLFQYYDLNGNYQRAVYYDHVNHPLNRNEVLALYEDRTEPWKGMVQNDEMPETWPSWAGFLPDDEGRLWVEKRTSDPDVTEYHILDASGELLAVFPWSSKRQVQHIQNGYLYSLEENEDGLREVLKYTFDL